MKIIKSFLKSTCSVFAKFCLKGRASPVFDPREVKKVLIYAYTGLGNFILYTPALRALKKSIPDAGFTLLHGNDTGCHEVLSGSNIFDRYMVLGRDADLWTKTRRAFRIRREKFDLIISEFHNNDAFIAFLTILSGARYKMGHVSSPGWENDWDYIYNIPVKMKKDQHEIDRYLELAYRAGISENDVDKAPFIQINSEDREFARGFFISGGIKKGDKIISVHFGTSPAQRWKQWNKDKFRSLCERILESPHNKVILIGSPNEADMAKNIADNMECKPLIAVGKTTIKQTAAIIEASHMLICNDSGLMHIAVAVDTPVAAIYGPTDYTRTAPLGEKHTIIRKDLDCSPCFRMDGKKRVENCPYEYKCLNSITVDEVFEVVKKKISNFSKSM